MRELQHMLIANNQFVPLYKQAYQIMQKRPPECYIFFLLLSPINQSHDLYTTTFAFSPMTHPFLMHRPPVQTHFLINTEHLHVYNLA